MPTFILVTIVRGTVKRPHFYTGTSFAQACEFAPAERMGFLDGTEAVRIKSAV
jgi:hypothetical protein